MLQEGDDLSGTSTSCAERVSLKHRQPPAEQQTTEVQSKL